jgi:hypothetical protein
MPYKHAMRSVGTGLPLAGLGAALLALALWVAGVPISWLDPLCGALFVAGGVTSAMAYVRGRDASVRRLAVLAVGANGLGLVWLALVWLSG